LGLPEDRKESEEVVRSEEIAELVAALPQGMDADEFIVKLVSWAVDIERDAIIRMLEAYQNLEGFTSGQVVQATIEAIKARGDE
jgi:hypothetical protein